MLDKQCALDRQPHNVLLWTNVVRQNDSVLVLSIPFETVNFVQFSWDAVFFSFHGGIYYLQILTILITRIVIIIFENLEDVLSIFLCCILFLFRFCGLFIVGLHLTYSSALCTKLGH